MECCHHLLMIVMNSTSIGISSKPNWSWHLHSLLLRYPPLLMIATSPTLTAITCKPFLIMDPDIYIAYYSDMLVSSMSAKSYYTSILKKEKTMSVVARSSARTTTQLLYTYRQSVWLVPVTLLADGSSISWRKPVFDSWHHERSGRRTYSELPLAGNNCTDHHSMYSSLPWWR